MNTTPRQRWSSYRNQPARWWTLFAVALVIVAIVLAATAWGSDSPQREPIRETVDVIELNHVIDANDGRECFLQIIFWEWHPLLARFDVIAWRIRRSDSVFPVRTPGGAWQLTFHDGEVLRVVTARSSCETWDIHDKEVAERSLLPESKRLQLQAVRSLPTNHNPQGNNQ